MRRVSHHLSTIVLGIMTMSFICYFSLLSLGRVRQLWASYYDLGIMHQTVYNSYMSLREADASRFLELTDPHGSGRQIKRMAIHNDVILGLLAPLYFIYDGPEALLIAQIVVVMSGAWALYLIGRHYHLNEWQVVIISLSYMLYPPLQRSILFDFHAVVMATGLLLWMHYAWLKKRYGWWVLLLILALLTKEHVGFTIAAWAIMMSLFQMKNSHHGRLRDIWQCVLDRRVLRLGLVALLSVGWVLVCVFVIMPHARTDDHFAFLENNLADERVATVHESSNIFRFSLAASAIRNTVN
jgi:uncharacterized membrane protein